MTDVMAAARRALRHRSRSRLRPRPRPCVAMSGQRAHRHLACVRVLGLQQRAEYVLGLLSRAQQVHPAGAQVEQVVGQGSLDYLLATCSEMRALWQEEPAAEPLGVA